MSKLFNLVKSKLHFWFLSGKSQFSPKDREYISLERLASTASLRSYDSVIVKDIITLLVKLEPYNFEFNESEDAIRIPLNHPKRIMESLEI
jgi:hypothetical protein